MRQTGGLGAGDQKGPLATRFGRGADPCAYVAVAEAVIKLGLLADESGQGQDLSPGKQLAAGVTKAGRVEGNSVVLGPKFDDTFTGQCLGSRICDD